MTSPGSALSERFFAQAVRPIIEKGFPAISYVAARLGTGSDVLGLDDERSADHDFGCRLTLLLEEEGAGLVRPLIAALEAELPQDFEGWPVRFPTSANPAKTHQVRVSTVRALAIGRLGFDPSKGLGPEEWLCITGQSVLEVTAGAVFWDSTTEYTALRTGLEWYPKDIWLYVLASGWVRLSQEMPFVGRTGERGDEAGSAVLAARLARDIIHLAFLIHRRWPPYPKWTGTVLSSLPSGPSLSTELSQAMNASDWREREEGLCRAIELLAEAQAGQGLPAARPAVQGFFDRPFRTVSDLAVEELMAGIVDPAVGRLPRGLGSIEQWCDNVDILSNPTRRALGRAMYHSEG